MSIFFLLVVIAMLIAGVSDAALSFDGSVYLFQVLDTQAPHMPNDRVVNLVLQLPVIVASYFTRNLTILRIVFGLVYASIPVLALVASWWIVRERSPHLFVWPALCIGLATLPGQFYLVSEAMYAMHLAWPIVLAILVRAPPKGTILAVLCAMVIMVSHPFAVMLLGFALVIAMLAGWFFENERAQLWGLALVMAILLTGSSLYFLLARSSYEAGQLSIETLVRDFSSAVVGFPLTSLFFTWLAALALLIQIYRRSRSQINWMPVLFATEFLSLAMACSLLVLWASRPDQWTWASGYRPTALITSLAFMGVATGETLWRKLRPLVKTEAEADWLHRSRTVHIVAIAFLLVLVTQSLTWRKVTGRLRETMNQSSWSCISQSSIGWISETPLSWTTPMYSILIQGSSPEKVVLPGDGCAEESLTEGIALTQQFAPRAWNGGWFNLEPLNNSLTMEREEATHTCWWQLVSGWYEAQQSLGSDYWWRWSASDAKLRVFTENETVVILTGEIESIQQPNQVFILVNGARQRTMDVTWYKMAPLGSLELNLPAGVNEIVFVSQNPSIILESGDRPLAIALANLQVSRHPDSSLCTFRP